MLFIETPTNPVMRLTDLAAVGQLARRHHIKLVVDNTFASPCLQRPIEFGADLVVHSTTKYLNGHSDSVGGIVIAVHDEDIECAEVHPERSGRDPEPARFVADPAWNEDPCAAYGAAQCERPGARRVSGAASEGQGRCCIRDSRHTHSMRSHSAR